MKRRCAKRTSRQRREESWKEISATIPDTSGKTDRRAATGLTGPPTAIFVCNGVMTLGVLKAFEE